MSAARRVLALALAALALAAPAEAANLHQVAVVRLTVHAGQIERARTSYVFGARQTVVAFVYVNGQEIPTSQTKAAATILYAGDGTMVAETIPAKAGVAHVKVTTWLRTARIVVRFATLKPLG